jgi:hypothetical protein
VRLEDIASAIFRGDWKYAVELAADYATKYLSTCSNQQKIVSALSKASSKVKAIVDDPAKTEDQKRAEIYKLIDDSILASQGTSRPGDPNELNATYRYSLDYGIARLAFDVQTRDDRCEQIWGFTVIDPFFDYYSGELRSRGTSFSYAERRHSRTPNIYVYRQVDGYPEELVVRFDGRTTGGTTTYNFGGPGRTVTDAAWDAAKKYAWEQVQRRYNGKPADPVTRVSVDVPTSAYLQPGRRVAYRLAAEWPKWNYPKGNNCEYTFVKHALIYVDGNADGRVDAATSEEYAKHFSQFVGPIVPAMFLVL